MIKNDSKRPPVQLTKRHTFISAGVFLGLALLIKVIGFAHQAVAHVLNKNNTATELIVDSFAGNWKTLTVAKGDSLASLFQKNDLSQQLLHNILDAGEAHKELSRIKPGEHIYLLFNVQNELVKLVYPADKLHTLIVTKTDEGYSAELRNRDLTTHVLKAEGTINDSLYLAGEQAGLNDNQTMQLAYIFGWDIDFAREIQPGDSFKVLYTASFDGNKMVHTDDIVAAEFTHKDNTYKAVLYTDPDGHVGYYSPSGLNMRRPFLRTPIKYTRISGYFGNRYHPVLHRFRKHQGVDYAAPTGTPIKASGDGVIIFRGEKGGYGNAIVIKHGSKYSTLYGHMSRFAKGFKTGSKVKQGDIIGYVGMTGLATGPHLHYEFRINGVHRDPLKVKLPGATPINKKYLADFKPKAAKMIAELESPTGTAVVQAD